MPTFSHKYRIFSFIVFNYEAIGIGIFGNIDDEPNLVDSEIMLAAVLKFIDDMTALGKISKDYWIFSREDHDKLNSGTVGPSGAFLEKLRELEKYCNSENIQECI